MKKVKRSRICTAALIFIFVLLTGCGKEEVKEESKTETLVTEQAEVEIPVPDKQEEMIEIPIEKEPVISAQYTKTVTEAYGNDEITLLTKKVNDISFQIPENEHAQEEINAFFEERNAAWEDTVALYVEVVEADYASWKEQEDGGEWKTHEIGRLYEVKRLDEQMLCVVEDTFVYTGGERTNYVRVAYNFDTWTGQRLSLEEAASHLDEIRMESLDYITELLEEEEYEDVLKKDYANYLEDILTDSTWYTDDKGLYVICNENIIAPAKEGIMEFFLPYDEVDVIDEVYQPETETDSD